MKVPIKQHAFVSSTLTTLALTVCCGCGGRVSEFTAGDPSLAADLPEMKFAATDWPFWRGLSLTSEARGELVIEADQPPPQLWKTALGFEGHASPIVHGDVVYIAAADRSSKRQLLLAFDRNDGSPLWETQLHEGGFIRIHPRNSHASATPACDGDRIFAVSAQKDGVWLSAVSLDGKLMWQKKVGPFRSQHGYGSSPLLYKSLVIVVADSSGGGFLTALHRETGDVVWRVRRSSSPSFCTPVVAQVAGKTQLLMSGHNKVNSYDPATGKSLWVSSGPARTTANTLVWNNDLVFASGGYPEQKIMAIKADGSGEVAWSVGKKVYVPSMLVSGNRLFAIQDSGVAHCYEAGSGKKIWTKRLGGSFSGSPLLLADRIFVASEKGIMTVFRVADEYERVARFSVGDGCFATPVICGKRMFVRTGKALICYGE